MEGREESSELPGEERMGKGGESWKKGLFSLSVDSACLLYGIQLDWRKKKLQEPGGTFRGIRLTREILSSSRFASRLAYITTQCNWGLQLFSCMLLSPVCVLVYVYSSLAPQFPHTYCPYLECFCLAWLGSISSHLLPIPRVLLPSLAG